MTEADVRKQLEKFARVRKRVCGRAGVSVGDLAKLEIQTISGVQMIIYSVEIRKRQNGEVAGLVVTTDTGDVIDIRCGLGDESVIIKGGISSILHLTATDSNTVAVRVKGWGNE